MGEKAKRQTLLVSVSGRHGTSVPDIWHTEINFFYGHRYLPGSGLVGKYDRPWLHGNVCVRFQHDTKNSEYAPRISFDLEDAGARKLSRRVVRAAEAIRKRYEDIGQDNLIAELGAVRVTYAGNAWTWEPETVAV
jgi:hypothetical protein